MVKHWSGNARGLVALTGAMLLTALAIGTATAQAGENWYARMPAKTWSTNGDYHASLHYMYIEKREGPGSMCMGPATYNGSWSFPYGWDCSIYNAFGWEFGPIGAYPAVDNPNSQPFTFALRYV